MTERTHVSASAEPIVLQTRVQSSAPTYKPTGFWYEVDGDWQRWCRDDGMTHWLQDRFLHRLELGAENMLVLSSAADLDTFTAEYGVATHWTFPSPGHESIDWRRVASRYDGIEIDPYIWSRRLELMWYYGWDCGSGCIWTPRDATVALVAAEPLAVPA